MFDIISTEVVVSGDVCDILEAYYKNVQQFEKIFENEIDSESENYGDNNRKDRIKYVNDKLNKLKIHEKFEERKILTMLV